VEAILSAADMIFATGRVAGLNVACTWDPGYDGPEGIRALVIAELLAKAG
jgi:hypothetical protein